MPEEPDYDDDEQDEMDHICDALVRKPKDDDKDGEQPKQALPPGPLSSSTERASPPGR